MIGIEWMELFYLSLSPHSLLGRFQNTTSNDFLFCSELLLSVLMLCFKNITTWALDFIYILWTWSSSSNSSQHREEKETLLFCFFFHLVFSSWSWSEKKLSRQRTYIVIASASSSGLLGRRLSSAGDSINFHFLFLSLAAAADNSLLIQSCLALHRHTIHCNHCKPLWWVLWVESDTDFIFVFIGWIFRRILFICLELSPLEGKG